MKQHYPQMTFEFDESRKAVWLRMKSEPVPCFTPVLLNSLKDFFNDVRSMHKRSRNLEYRYVIGASGVPGVYNLGGDLQLFMQAIMNRERDILIDYAVNCIDTLYEMISHLQCDGLTTISLVCGDALGGGFEAALAANVLIAEKGSRMGLPEVLFNLFPGMGAYSLLSRRIGCKAAEKMILSGRIYLAEELFEMGIVDILAEKAQGNQAVSDYIAEAERSPNSRLAMQKVVDYCHPLFYRELLDIVSIWVDAALKLTDKDLKTMSYLVKKQRAKFS